MNKTAIVNGRVLVDSAWIDTDITIENGKISSLEKIVDTISYQEIIDAKNKSIIPGLIDIHTHGGNGIDVNHATKEDLFKLSEFFASKGVTGYLPTVMTDTHETMCKLLGNIADAKDEQLSGSKILGIHMEGPFLCQEFKGAMPEYLIQDASVQNMTAYQESSRNNIKYVTVSPENKGIEELIKYLKDQGIIVSMGHTGADYDQCMKCIRAGVKSSTHVFNAMGTIHQHRPSAIGAALGSDVYSEMICDGFHLHPAIVALMIKAKGNNRVLAITDSMMAAGLGDGHYKLGINDIVVEDGDAKLASSGVRAGSTLTMDKAVRNLMKFTGLGLETIIQFVSLNQARILGLDEVKGTIQIGKDADLVLLSEDYVPIKTIVEGRTVYTKN